MTTGRFRAAVQYDDWKGSAAADDADEHTYLSELLKSKGLFDPDTELLVAVERAKIGSVGQFIDVDYCASTGDQVAANSRADETGAPVTRNFIRSPAAKCHTEWAFAA